MRLLTLCLFLALLFGCEPTPQAPGEQSTANSQATKSSPAALAEKSGIFQQPIEPLLMELPNEALAHWRTDNTEKPALVLFSYDPLLKQIDPALREQANQLTLAGSPEQLRRHGSFNSAEPVILPIQTVAAALDAGLFSEFYWVFPSKVAAEQLELELFRKQLLEQQLLSEPEAAALSLTDGIYSGEIRGIPFAAIHHQKLNDISEPLILHIEMGFFRGLYDNEIKSPLYTLMHDTAVNIRAHNWQPLVTSLSYSTIEGAVSLDVRFVLSDFAQLLRQPTLLDGEMPKEWQIRNESLYAGDMYSESKKIELAKQVVKLAPESAAAHFDHFQALFMSKQLEPALGALAEAVKRDPGYAASYFELSQMALQAGNTAMGLDLLTLAEENFPENPFVPLQKAYLLASFGQFDEAEQQLAKLPEQWSPIFHQDIPAKITAIEQLIETGRKAASEKQ